VLHYFPFSNTFTRAFSDFAAERVPGTNSGSTSDVQSLLSVISASNSSTLASSLPKNNNSSSRSRSKPNAGGEERNHGDRSNHTALKRPGDNAAESYIDATTSKTDQHHAHRKYDGRSKGPSQPAVVTVSAPEMTFPRSKVPPIRPLQSYLTTMMASSGASSNPFAENYAAISGRAESASTNVQVYFPHARQPAGKSIDLNVRKDASVEEVIGFALWSYWEAGWSPKLDDGLKGEEDPNWGTKLATTGWVLRIAEEDGEVDDEFPRGFALYFTCIV
jgi:target of rapamycin complex 2 subunit MAPKAP1